MSQELVLVNENDEQVGTGEKMMVHREGLLHRAFSVFVFNPDGEMLLQQRSIGKYHSGGLWTNTCCSHPAPGEELEPAARKRLREEMGFEVPLVKQFDFIYKAGFGNGLTEYEFDHVLTGEFEGQVLYNPEEVMDYRYDSMEKIAISVETEPALYTAWFRIAFPKINEWWTGVYKK